jgi:phosphoglycolate phosphatase
MRLAIFDIDGTLVNSRAMITASLTAAFAAEGLTAPAEARMLSVVGLSLVEAMRQLAPGEEAIRHDRLATAYKQAFWDHRAANEHSEALFDGVMDLLGSLRRRGDVILGIATGKSVRGVQHLLERHGLEGWFATIQTADHHPSKPHPSMVVQALTETGAERHQAIVIGDTSYDIEMARAAGVGALGVTWGNHPRNELERAGAHYIVNDFSVLEQTLDLWWQQETR